MRVAREDEPRAEALRARRADVVGAQHLDHRAAHQPRDAPRMGQRQHGDRQDQVMDRAV